VIRSEKCDDCLVVIVAVSRAESVDSTPVQYTFHHSRLFLSILQHRKHQVASHIFHVPPAHPTEQTCAKKQRVPSVVSLPSILSCTDFATSLPLPLAQSMTMPCHVLTLFS
jgi:hypothetical protein